MPLSPAEARSTAETLSAQLAGQAPRIAELIRPPFSPAQKRKIDLAFSDVGLAFNTLSRLVVEARLQISFQDMTAHRYFAALSDQLALWNQARVIARSIVRVQPPRSNPEDQPLLAAYALAFTRLHAHFLDEAARLAPPDWPNVGHRDIALPFTRFLIYAALARRLCRALGRTGPLSFVDVGCGVGLKLLQAQSLFEKVSGIEYEPHRADAAARWLGEAAKILTADALTFDDYGNFDVIYAFKPVQDDALMRKTEDRIVEQARPGTVLIMPYMDFDLRHEELGCHQIMDAVYVAKASVETVNRARALLPHVGEALPTGSNRSEGFSAPILKALRRWGHLG